MTFNVHNELAFDIDHNFLKFFKNLKANVGLKENPWTLKNPDFEMVNQVIRVWAGKFLNK